MANILSLPWVTYMKCHQSYTVQVTLNYEWDPSIMMETAGAVLGQQDRWAHCTWSNPHILQQRKQAQNDHRNFGFRSYFRNQPVNGLKPLFYWQGKTKAQKNTEPLSTEHMPPNFQTQKSRGPLKSTGVGSFGQRCFLSEILKILRFPRPILGSRINT